MIRSFAACRRGAAAVEAGLVMPLLITLGLAAADAGYMFSETHRMKAGLATAARYLAKAPNPQAVEAAAANLAVTGRRTGEGQSRVAGWTPSQVQVSYRMVSNTSRAFTGADQLRIIRLQSTRPYTGFGLLSLVGLGSVEVSASHEERWTGS
jgi:Flp pilus assembly protein TadG